MIKKAMTYPNSLQDSLPNLLGNELIILLLVNYKTYTNHMPSRLYEEVQLFSKLGTLNYLFCR